ncbi:EscV/YscV/HrcV family type III secretion system export apparatus protein [Pseudomonas chlororaphis]|uniref:EscV/YscV/HrcV family type III secretion system export apparatus protein n=1 Tax=Pseudomonas chlororaphis TaxID=587753 RepID=UPI0015DF9888|nr:EscV/YscV/HrcV family type III secretion system export apparatus protein [Pseudomonas chlororaphis]QLL13473.1 EscV/YscV/HrcV family type III secretion system export apparatus protein [Pseudomonas chlororaphis subsp. aurantiaca]
MKHISKWLALAAQRQDVVLAIVLLVAVFMMIVPLPTWLVDMLIAINLTVSVILLMMSLYIRDPLEFSVFPSLLLMTTLFRLALTISTTRLILLQADAGEIIYTFGSFVVGGNLGVGLIVFLIITVVQFIVITKGSERVAEVGARFSLDAMPGKQMSIDGDMRAGVIDAHEARRLRSQVQKESQLYGAMDGAMKFVKGDAIAGIIIIMVNILGGAAVGVFMHGMSAGESMSTYALLSIGDGLIGQIPALLISIAAGIIVTRVPGEQRQNLADDMSDQITRYPQALTLAACVLIAFALIPGFPFVYFLLLSAVIFSGAWWLKRRRGSSASGTASSNHGDPERALPVGGDAEHDSAPGMKPGAEPLLIQVSGDLLRKGALRQSLSALRYRMFERLGIPLPDVHVQENRELAPGNLQVLLYLEPVLQVKIHDDMLLADAATPPQALARQTDALPFNGLQLQWFDASASHALAATGVTIYEGDARIVHCVSLAIERYASDFVGVQETRYLMDAMEDKYAELVKEVQRQLPIGRIADVLQRLVGENVSIRDLRTIFEALIVWAPREKDPLMIAEYARMALRRHITTRQRAKQMWISAWTIGDRIEGIIRESIRQTSAGSYSSLTPEQNQAILGCIRSMLEQRESQHGVLLTAIDVRRFLRKLLEREFYHLHVLSFQEVSDEHEMRVIGNIDLIGEA